jgi:hypothetical protein
MLNNASVTSGGSTSSPTSLGAGSTATSYMLQGSQLEGHVGQRVEVTGMLLPEPRTTTRRSTSQTAATTGSPAASTPQLRVTSVRMVAANCLESPNR